MDFIEFVANSFGESSPLDLTPTQIPELAERHLQMFPAFRNFKVSPSSLRFRFLLIKLLNILLKQLLPLIDLRRSIDTASAAGIVRTCREFIFRRTKIDFIKSVLDSTACNDFPTPVIIINRLELADKMESGIIEFEKDTHFGIAKKQLCEINPFKLRPRRPHGTEPFLSFEVVFKGQHVVGTAGPYRQFFAEIGPEIVSEESPLFIPLPSADVHVQNPYINSNINESIFSSNVTEINSHIFESSTTIHQNNENDELYIIRPSATSSAEIQMFEFLGVLIGCCIRTDVKISLNLPAFVWKPLVFDSLTPKDLAEIDPATFNTLKGILDLDEPTFLSHINETFITSLSDQSSIEIKENGSQISVNLENREEYVQLVFDARLHEHDKQINAIRKGISKIIPIQLLYLLTWRELELLICGHKDIDIDLLKRHTEYSKGIDENSNHVKNFWEMLNDFDHDRRRQFIRFAWAQDRLPADDEEFERSRTRLMINPLSKVYPNPDVALPKAHTCFFNLELPEYSTREIMEEKFMYAITQTVTMNADEENMDDDGRPNIDYSEEE